MPVLISEIHVSATVSEPITQESSSPPGALPAADINPVAAAFHSESAEDVKNKIIRECVDRVMEMIRDQKER